MARPVRHGRDEKEGGRAFGVTFVALAPDPLPAVPHPRMALPVVGADITAHGGWRAYLAATAAA
ncbi:MAG: hypothetical protein ACK5YI_00790 [Rhodospirillales bacterium]|jgi:hypothetical protein